jgi:two-component system nitrogen regulation sensor histidine kinase NtrY
LKQFGQKYWLYLLSFFFLVCFYFYYQSVFDSNYEKHVQHFQANFLKKEKELKAFVAHEKKEYLQKGIQTFDGISHETDFFFHIYRNDSLIFWNTNELPVLRFAEIHFPTEGIVKLQNAWYYTKTFRKGDLLAVASFKIKKEYSFENEYLKNDFLSDFHLPFKANIVLEKENNFPIYNQKKEFLFAIAPIETTQIGDFQSNLLVLFLLLGVVFLLYGIFISIKELKISYQFAITLSLIVIHYFNIRFDFYDFMSKTTFYDPALYASSNWFPNLLILILNCIFIFFFITVLVRVLKHITKTKRNQILAFSSFIFTLIFAFFIAYLYQSLVKDSSIPLEIEKLFKLNYYSFWATFSMGILFFAYFILVKTSLKALLKSGLSKSFVIVLWFSSGFLYFTLDILYGSQLLFSAFWPLVINGFIVLNLIRSNGKFSFNYGVVLLFLFASYISININEFLDKKEKQERELFATQLATEQDISSEIEFQQLNDKLQNEKYFSKIFDPTRTISVTEFKDFMERKYFTGFWERYEMDFYLFDEDSLELIANQNIKRSTMSFLEEVIHQHSVVSEIEPHIFYIKDYTSQLSYISKQQFYNSDSTQFFYLFTTMKSKRIPEKIGFPRLLISDKANVFKAIENYSIAKYYGGKLISQNGKFSYPTADFALTNNVKNAKGYFDSEEYTHFLFRKNFKDLIVLSKKNPSFFQLFTSFSYLFCFFGFFLLIPVIIQNVNNFELSNLTLALKIQLVLVSIVVISLLFFGIGSGKFVSNQYQDYSNELIKEKVKSVLIEVQHKLEKEKKLKIETHGENINYLLQKFANVFVTDINLYDEKGFLLGSSRPKIYNAGLLSEQINPTAFDNLKNHRKSEFIHQENIGKINYLSAYVPLYNDQGNFLAYINLQQFGQQQGFENQIENFLVAIINVFILLLAFSIILSIIASNWVTSPLKIIQQSFAKIQLGKYNEPIEYQSNDEIGALVKNYNQKLEELAFTAQQLAQSERESAWREMAKQVAHEIKNPLTPMKLSLQHFQRIFDPNDSSSKEKLDKVVLSIVEQIDALTLIANEFSNFAKMPQENKENIDILPLIQNAILVFNQENVIDIQLENQEKEIKVFADKDLIIRVFNNLIKNAIQAIPEDRIGKICIRITKEERLFLFEIEDNGKGIPNEQKNKIFVPNFTTKSTGTGLGLAMVKQIVELHGGRIWFKTVENQGTSFYFELNQLVK